MDAETTQMLESIKAEVSEKLAARGGGKTDVQEALQEHDDARWTKNKRRMIQSIAGAAVAALTTWGGYAKFAPDKVDQQKANDLVHLKQSKEIIKTRSQMVESVKFLADKIDAESVGADTREVAKPPALVEAEADVAEKELEAEAGKLLELTPEEMKQVKQ